MPGEQRMKKEVMCIENLGSPINNGKHIPNGVPFRMINSPLNNNPAATALTDDEIEELSKHNVGAYGPGRSEYDTYYQIKFVGKFSFDNICFAIIRPCRCVKSHDGDIVTLETAKFWTMNTITKLIQRLNQDEIYFLDIYRIENESIKIHIAHFETSDSVISFIQEDKVHKHDGLEKVSEVEKNNEIQKSQTKKVEKENADITDELKMMRDWNKDLERNLAEKCMLLDELQKENEELKEKLKSIREICEVQ